MGWDSRGCRRRGLELVPDSSTHGCIAPPQLVPLATYVSDLELTRTNWQIDES
jgi:hypothetical protein